MFLAVTRAFVLRIRPGNEVGMQTRKLDLGQADSKTRSVPVTLATETPVRREGFSEVLGCLPSECDLSRAPLPLIISHDHRELNIGIVDDLRLKNRKLTGVARFGSSERALEVFGAIEEGIVRYVSVGYEYLDEGTPVGNGTLRFRWRPYEMSAVAVPADPNAGFYRSKEFSMNQDQETQQSRSQRRAAERSNTETMERVNELLAIGEQFANRGGVELAAQAIRENKDKSWLSKRILDNMRSDPLPTLGAFDPLDGGALDLSAGDQRRYSLIRLIRAAASGDWSNAGFERECHAALKKQINHRAVRGFLVPAVDLAKRDHQQLAERSLSQGVASAGGYLVESELRPEMFIELLRSKSVVMSLGATQINGLRGNVDIPRQVTGSTAYWVSEDQAITQSQGSFGQIAMTPKTVGALTEVTHRLLIQSSMDAESLVLADLIATIGLAVDQAALNGSGTAGQPTGLLNTAGLGSVTGASLGWAGIVEFETDVSTNNADMLGNFAYLTTPAVRGLLKTREKATNTGQFCWENGATPGEGRMNGYRAEVSTGVPSATMIYGAWNQILIGNWNLLEILINPYDSTGFTKGNVLLRAMTDVDIAVRHVKAFSVSSSIT